MIERVNIEENQSEAVLEDKEKTLRLAADVQNLFDKIKRIMNWWSEDQPENNKKRFIVFSVSATSILKQNDYDRVDSSKLDALLNVFGELI